MGVLIYPLFLLPDLGQKVGREIVDFYGGRIVGLMSEALIEGLRATIRTLH